MLPLVLRYDTRQLNYIRVPGEIVRELALGYFRAQADTLEDAWCLYGYVTGDTVVVDSLSGAETRKRDSHSITFASRVGLQGCPNTSRFVGSAHTHLTTTSGQPTQFPSSLDFGVYWGDPRAILMIIVHGADHIANGQYSINVAWVIRDGRYGINQWQGG